MIDNKNTEQVSLDYLYNLAFISPHKPLSVEEYIEIHNHLKCLDARYKTKYTKIIKGRIIKYKPLPINPDPYCIDQNPLLYRPKTPYYRPNITYCFNKRNSYC